MPRRLPPFKEECFFITPIGADGSLTRDRSDAVLKHIVRPAMRARGFKVVRADEISRGGHITLQVVEHCANAAIAVADLTSMNPNVFYELGLRHARKLPTLLISEDQTLPFDIAQLRTIFFDHNNLDSADACRAQLRQYVDEATAPEPYEDSPVGYVEAIESMRKGSTQDRSIAAMLVGMDRLLSEVGDVAQIVSRLDDRIGEYSWDADALELEGSEPAVLQWAAAAFGMLGSEMREAVLRRLGFTTGQPMSPSEVADELDMTADEVEQMVRSAFQVWTSAAFHRQGSGAQWQEFEFLWRELAPFRAEPE